MNKKWKRIFSMVLALAIIVTMLPTSGLRAEAAENDTQTLPKGQSPESVANDNLTWVAGEENRVCDYFVEHTHSSDCYRRNCGHENGHGNDCYSAEWALCPGGNHDAVHTETMSGSEAYKDLESEVLEIAVAIYKKAYSDAYNRISGSEMKKALAGIAAGNAALAATTFCYSVPADAEPTCGHGDACSEVGGTCYSKICLFNYEHTHVDACYTVTWTHKADVNNNEVADDVDTYYSVSFNVNGGNESYENQSVLTGMTAQSVADPNRTGYTFVGWFPALTTKIEADTEFVAQWDAIEYTITWKYDDGSVYTTTKADYGSMPVVPADPEKKDTAEWDYTFTGWTPEVSVVNGETSYKAVFSAVKQKYVVTFVNEDGTLLQSSELEYGETPEYTGETPTKADTADATFTFAGWDTQISVVTGEKTYTATYSDKKLYDITFVQGNGQPDITDKVEEEEIVTAPETDPTREGYRFDGWYTDANYETEFISGRVTADTVIYAKWVKQYTVTYVSANHTAPAAQTVDVGTVIDDPGLLGVGDKTDGLVMIGWFIGETEVQFPYVVEDDVIITAKWAADTDNDELEDGSDADPFWTVTYVDGNGNTLYSGLHLDGTEMPTIDVPTFAGYSFSGWDIEVADTVTADVTYTAQWIVDVNSNQVDDKYETITIVTEKAAEGDAVTVNGDNVTTYIYDSVNGETVTIVATPVTTMNGQTRISTTYVSSIFVDEAVELSYSADYSVTYALELSAVNEAFGENDGNKTVTVAFKEAKFTLDDDGEMRFYVNMELPDKETLYNAVITDPAWSEENVLEVKYLAREAVTLQYTLPELGTFLGITLGGNTIDIPLNDLWLDVGTTIPKVDYDAVVQAEVDKIKAEIAAVDLSSWSALGQIVAIGKKLINLGGTISAQLTYLGAHTFGATATPDESATEILRIVYENEAMHIENEAIVVTLIDDREAAYINGNDVELEYDEYDDESLMDAINATLTDKDGNVISGDVYKISTMAGKSVGEYTVTLYFDGNYDYKPATATVMLKVIKAPASMDIPNINVYYGESYDANPVITNKHGEVINIDSLRFIVGLDIAELDVDGDGIHGLKSKVQLLVPDELQNILSAIGLGDGAKMTLSQLVEFLNSNIGILENWGLTQEMVDTLNSALETINGLVEAGDMEITIGGKYPTNIGAYLTGAVTVDGNYETAFDVAYILIKPVSERVYLDFNYTDTNGVFTPELLQHVNLGASAYDEEALTTLNADATALVNNVFFGIDTNGELVATLFNGDVDPENIENELGNGAYTQLSFIAEFGNEFYYAVPIVRAFVIMPNTVEVEIVDNEGTEFNRTFDNAEQTVDVELNYTAGTLIVPSEEYLTVTYSGVQTNGKTWNSETAPTHAGAYVVTAIYVQRDDKGEVIAIGADVQPMVVKPAETATTVEDLTVEFGTDVNYVEDMVTVETSSGVTMPDMTVITGSVAVDGDIVTAGWDAVEGNVNIDFPDWVDDVLKEHAPSIYDGMTASEFTAKVIEKVPGIIEKIEAMIAEYGIEADITQYVDTLVAALDEVKAIVDQLPVDVNLTFDEKLTEGRVGVYLVAAVVTDSDHMPSADMGILVIEPSDDLVVDIKDTTVTYNGQEQMPDVLAMIGENYVTTDMVYVIINEELNANLILEDDAQALLDLIAAELGVEEVPESITLGELKAALEGIMSDIKAEAADSSLAAVIAALGITKEDIKAVIAELETKVIGYLTEKGLTAESGISLNAAKPVDAGIYKVCGLAIVENYIPQLTEGTLVIKPKEVTVTVADAEKTYGDADPEFTYEVEGLVEGDELDVTVSREEGETVGEYTITADYVENKNYVVTVVDGTLTINPKDVTVTVDSASKVYGDADPKFTATVNGLVGEDKLEISYSRETGEDVGEYAITATVADNKNYDVTVENTGKLTINPKEITAADVALDGTLVYNGSEQTQGVKITEGITYDVTGNTGNDAGDYTLTVTGNGNYTGEVELSWTIAKAEVVITVSDMEMVITDPVPELQYQVAVTAPGAVTAEQLGVQLSVDTDGKTLGKFDIEVIYTESYNWTVTVVDGKLTVGLGDYVCWNMQTGKYYAELSTALKEADDMDARTTSVETIQMLKDCTESYIMVTTGTTLDLNGFKVTSRFVAAVDGAHIIDSQNCTGRLVTGMNNVTLDEQNKMLPVYDGDAYIFGGNTLFAISKDNKYTGDGFKLNTLPAPDTRIAELLKDGAVDNNLQIIVRLTWDTDQGVKSQDFSFREEVIEEVYQSHTGDKQTSYTLRFYMIITGIEGVDNLRANILFASGTDTEIISANSLSIN